MSPITKEFTKEQLIERLQHRISVASGFPESEKAQMDLELARIALASIEAEAYGYVHKAAYEQAGSCGLSSDHEAYRDSPTHIAVYTVPPAPVALTSGYSDFEEIWSSSTHPLTQDDEMKDFAWDIWNACRAAMLQGADGNSPVIPDCSCRTCRPVTFSDSRFVVCPECGNKRCPHANDHRNACTGSNEPGQEGSAYPAAPQQEVAQALAKGMERYGDAMQELAKKEVK